MIKMRKYPKKGISDEKLRGPIKRERNPVIKQELMKIPFFHPT